MQFAEINWLHAIWGVPLLIGLVLWAMMRSRQQMQRFVAAALAPRVTIGFSPRRRMLKGLLMATAFALVALGLARPQWNPQPEEITRVGRDVCFVLDVSRSMLAEDLAPNRLERAKLWIEDVTKVLEGDRVGLVVFAGSPVVKCPLTHDYGFFRLALEETDTQSVSRGGTLIGDALRLTLREVFGLSEADDQREARHRDIILITDGEDHESLPVDAAAVAGAAGVRLIAIGIGDEAEGTPIPIEENAGRQRYLTYQGEIVRSRLDSATLLEMVQATPGGVMLTVATGDIALDEVYRELVLEAERNALAEGTIMRYDEKFQIFLGLALTLLLLEAFIGDSRRRRFERAYGRRSPASERGTQNGAAMTTGSTSRSGAEERTAARHAGRRRGAESAAGAAMTALLIVSLGGAPNLMAQPAGSPAERNLAPGAGGLMGGAAAAPPGAADPSGVQGAPPPGSDERQARVPDGATFQSEIDRGNRLYADGDAAAALEAYENAIGLQPLSPEAKYNAGCAHYALGEFDAAVRRFRDAVATPGAEAELVDRAEYNIGRTLLERSRAELEDDPRQAMSTLERAEESFEDVVRRRPTDRDAIRNLEFTRQTLHDLREAMRRQQEMREEAQRLSDELRELAEEQQAQAEQSPPTETPQGAQDQEDPSAEAPPDATSEQPPAAPNAAPAPASPQQESPPQGERPSQSQQQQQQQDGQGEPRSDASRQPDQPPRQQPPGQPQPPDAGAPQGGDEAAPESDQPPQPGTAPAQRDLRAQAEQLREALENLRAEAEQNLPPDSPQRQQIEDALDRLNEALENQREAEEALEENRTPEARREQEEAAEDLQSAAEALDQEPSPGDGEGRQQQEQQQQQQGSGGQTPPTDGQPSPSDPGAQETPQEEEGGQVPPMQPESEEAGEAGASAQASGGPSGGDELAESIIDKERRLREARREHEESRRRGRGASRSERDW